MLFRIGALCLAFTVCAQDDAISSGLAKGAAQLAAAGKTEKAKDMLFQALANDAKNSLALLELSKLSDDDAGDLCWRAYQTADKADTQLVAGILRQMSRCNPTGVKLVQALEAHNAALLDIGKRYSDELTASELADRGIKVAGAKPKGLTKESIVGVYKWNQPGVQGEVEFFPDGTQTNAKGTRKPEYKWEINAGGDLVVKWVNDTHVFQLKPDGSIVEKTGGWKIERVNRPQAAKR